ncbi:unnamed protein product [Rotaria sordida]|uniref:VLIG-type G domain-containing protein n=1 Tax=Rotaria sordida TaxID=392033 RepID=A0A818N089_9BILA|nr:unnamed protein product [Rotaria sordida]
MWVDASVNSSKENLQAQKTLTKIHNQFKTFESVDECENAIQQLSKTSRAIIIINGGFGRELLPRIHDLPQVLTIYIFCMDQAKHLEWAKQFNKIKAIIVDLHKLISTIQFDHELRINVTKPIQINIPDTNSKSENKVLDTFRYSSKYLVIAGELQYTEKTMRDIATEIVNRFKSDPNRDFNVLISETVQPIMYLLKREQNLVDFSNPFKRLLSKEKDIPCVSQRFLIDTIMMNSDRFLCRRLTSLLSKRNSVPMIQPPLDSTNNEYRSISNIIPVWDYHRPVLLSFGIGQCKGKTSLMNTLFDSNFEQSMKDRYFSATIDVDFGYHFVERRPINIADTHGEISSETLAQISMLFNGFLIHVNSAYLCSNQSNVIKYLQLLSPESYVLLLIRDVDDENDEKIQSTVETICSVCSHCQSHYLPNVVDKTTDENREKIDEVREKIFRDTVQLQCLDEKSIQEYLKRLLNNTQKEIIEQDIAFINSIRSILIDGKEENYLLYTLFTKLCKKRLEVAKIDPYDKDFQDEKLYKLNLELFNADSEFKEKQRMGSHAYGAGFELFFNLLQKQESRLTKLNLLSMELRKEADKKKTGQKDLPFYNQLSLEIHWRNAIIGSTSLSNAELEILVNTYRDYIAEGNPFEIVDGDNFEMQGNFLTKVFELFPNKKFFVISIIGPQNSGKSTLLNFLFGTLFEARDGRCTKGIYGTLINVQSKTNKNQLIPLDYDYILVIDTEGLLSIQKHDEQYDKRLILFCLAVSHLVIVNVEIEINEAVRKFFVLCTQALKYLGETRVIQPTVHFVLNKRPNPDEEYCKTLLECVRTTLKDNKLDNEINLQPDNFHVLSTAFNRNPFKILNGKCAAFSTDITFVTNVQKLCKFLIDTSSDIIRQTGDGFCVPTSWIAFAHRILQTIKKHPDLTHFQDVFERDQYNKIRDDIRRDFDQYLSPTVARYLMDKEKQNNTDNIKDSFKIEYERVLKTLEDRLREHCGQCQASENIQERSSRFMQVQLISIFRSWEVSARMTSERYKIDQIVNDIENKLRTKAISVTHKNYLMDKQSATEICASENKSKLIERFLPWVVLIENDDENVATNRINELSQVLCQLFQPQIKEIIEKHVNNEMTKTLNRCSIIKELDDEVYHATDDWLKRYVLYPIDLIIERFNEKWTKVKAEVDAKLNMIVNLVSMRLRDIFELIKTVNTISQELGAHSLSFVDSLFKLKDEQKTDHANDKQFCMSKLFYLYLVGEDIPSEISTRNGSIYTVDSKWRTIIDHFPKPSAKIKQIFCLLQNAFEMSTISYLGFFLDEILSRQSETELIVSNQLASFIRKTYRIIEEQLSNRMRGCQARCPCCKRICDVDHHLNITSPIGQEENRHCCKFGHQIRGMGGIRYEITDEASTSWCEIIKDNDPITTGNNIRQTWKNFKSANADWDFGDGLRVREKLETSYAYIWEKIGKQLCDHFGNGMKFGKQNTPSPVNHFIFVLDHSGSMNERSNILTRLITLTATANNSNETNLSPWEHLRRAVKGFIDIRIKQVSLNDEITMILFASRAERIYNREKLTDIDFNRINTPMNICGSGTNFSAAFQMVIKTLEEVNNDSERNKMQQTIIFMTDGEPQGYPTTELQQLRDYKTGS